MNNKQNWRRWLKISAAMLPLSLLSMVASAGVIGFTATGTGSWGPSCGSLCSQLTLTGNTVTSGLDAYFGSSEVPDFTFSALLDVSSLLAAGDWRLQDSSGDSLFGSIGGLSGAFLLGVTGGTGALDDVSGLGGLSGSLSRSGTFTGSGLLFVNQPSSRAAVPEPGTLTLFVGALAGLGWLARRRRLGLGARRRSTALP